jgi:hypothetical protein
MMPSETSVSIDAEPCRAFFSAARWNGHADHSATGAAQLTSSHCQPANRRDGISESISERSVSGTKNTSATISRRFRSAASRSSAAPSSPGWLPAGSLAAYPACSTAVTSSRAGRPAGAATRAVAVA